jgi:sulfide:quinone oxidoreductase
MPRNNDHPFEVVIVGGGVAGLEAAAALRALAGSRVRVKLIEPNAEFVYRPMSVAEPFNAGEARRYPLDRIAQDLGFELLSDSVDSVAPTSQHVFLEQSGDDASYDGLLIALGARPEPAWEHVLTFSGPRDVAQMRNLVDEVAQGSTQSVAFVVPPGTTWPLPMYELALMLAARAHDTGRDLEIAIFTPERDPLEVVGRDASRQVARDLDAAGIRVARSNDVEVTAAGDILIPGEEWPLRYERVVAVPRLAGNAPRGVPVDENGFVPIDAHGRVQGAVHVYAAGDCTNYPVKQGGLAAQQADAAAEVIARRAGAPVEPRRFPEVLRVQLFSGGPRRFMRRDLASRGTSGADASESALWWPASKIAGAYLSPYLASLEPAPTAPPARTTPDTALDHDSVRTVAPTAWIEESPYGE